MQDSRVFRMSPLHYFRRDYIASQQCAGPKNWFSTESWEEVRAAYNALSVERKQRYERERAYNLEKARCEGTAANKSTNKRSQPLLLLGSNRPLAQQTQQQQDAAVVQSGPAGIEPMVSGLNHPASVLANLLPGDFDKLKSASGNLVDMSRATRLCASEHLKSGDATVWPVEASNVLASLVTIRAKGLTLNDAHKDFCNRCQIIAGPRAGEPEFPKSVFIHGQCGTLCQLEYSTLDRLRHVKVVDALSEAVAFNKPTKVVQDDVLIACCAECGDQKIMHYFFMTAISNKGGYSKADSVQIFCKVVDRRSDDDYAARSLFQCFGCSFDGVRFVFVRL